MSHHSWNTSFRSSIELKSKSFNPASPLGSLVQHVLHNSWLLYYLSKVLHVWRLPFHRIGPYEHRTAYWSSFFAAWCNLSCMRNLSTNSKTKSVLEPPKIIQTLRCISLYIVVKDYFVINWTCRVEHKKTSFLNDSPTYVSSFIAYHISLSKTCCPLDKHAKRKKHSRWSFLQWQTKRSSDFGHFTSVSTTNLGLCQTQHQKRLIVSFY